MDKIETQEYQALTKVFADRCMSLRIHRMPLNKTELAELGLIIRGLCNAPSGDYAAMAQNANDCDPYRKDPNDDGQWDLHKEMRSIRANASLKNPLLGTAATRLTNKEKELYVAFENACVGLSKLLTRSCTDDKDDPYIKLGQLMSPDLPRPADESADVAWKNYCFDLRRQIDSLARKASELGKVTQAVSRKDLQNYMIELIYVRIASARKHVTRADGQDECKEFTLDDLAAITHQIWTIYFSATPVLASKVRRVIKEMKSKSRKNSTSSQPGIVGQVTS